jgi:hypothetical protein
MQGCQEQLRIVHETLYGRTTRGADCSPDLAQSLIQLGGDGLQGCQEQLRIVHETLYRKTF